MTWYKEMVKFWTYRIAETDQYEQQYGWIHALFRHCYSGSPEFRKYRRWTGIRLIVHLMETVEAMVPTSLLPTESTFTHQYQRRFLGV